jgi:nitrite reductase/ring-hydroxylating ferredoxin subunit
MTNSSEAFDTGVRPGELDSKRALPFETPWGCFALHLVEDRPVCAQSFCPHMEGPLFEGTRSGSTIICPWHGWRYDLANGACIASPRDEGERTRLAFLDVQVGASGTYVLTKPAAEAPA